MNKNKIKKFLPYVIILLASILVSIPLLSKRINIYQDDGIQHICRLIRTWQTIESKQFLPLIMSNELNNFGYSWNLFYSPLTAFAPLILKVFNLDFEEILKCFLFIVTYLSGIAMYKCTLKIIEGQAFQGKGEGLSKRQCIALISAIFYIFAPYRLTDMYIRMAVAELTSFIFIPIIFEGLYIITNESKRSYLLAVGAIGLILTHTVVTMYTAILSLIYLVIILAIKTKKKEKIKFEIIEIIKNVAFIIIITSFYWVPLLESYFATLYEVFVPGRMQRLEVLKMLKPKFAELFITKNSQERIYEIGWVVVVGLIFTVFAYKKVSKKIKPTYLFFLISGVVLTIISLDIFPFEKLPSILTMIQFTFRLLEFTSFFFGIIAAINFGIVIENLNRKRCSNVTNNNYFNINVIYK